MAAPEAWTVRSVLQWARSWLERKGVENPRLDAELLLASALGCDRVRLYVDHDKPLSAEELARFKDSLLRRADREPVAYILGVKEFYGRPFRIDKRAFIPRPETELFVQIALEHLRTAPAGSRALDLCAGSGAIGATLAAELPGLEVDLVEFSADAAELAQTNVAKHGQGRAHLYVGDLFAPLPQGLRYAAVLSNPPYVPIGDAPDLAPDIARHEPRMSIFGGADGLEVIRRIVSEAPRWLSPGGLLGLEMDPPEWPAILQLCSAAGLQEARVHKDLANLERIVTAKMPGVLGV